MKAHIKNLLIVFVLLTSLDQTANAQVMFFDNFQQFANGTDLTSISYSLASGFVSTSVQNGSPTISATNFLGHTWALFDNSVVLNKNQYEGTLSSVQTGQLLQVTWKMWIQATNTGPGMFLFSIPTSDPVANYNPPIVFMDTGAIVALTNGTSPQTTIGHWGSLAGTVMTNALILNYSNRTFSYSLNGQTLATLPLGTYFTNVVGAIYFNGFERSAGSLGNRFAISDVQAEPAYTFGPEVQKTNTASITYTLGTGVFQYTDANSSQNDVAYVPLTGRAATFITPSNGWTASLTVNLSARSMTATSDESPHNSICLGVMTTNGANRYVVFCRFNQENNTGGYESNNNPDNYLPNGFYGTEMGFLAQTNNYNDVTTPLGNSKFNNGVSWLQLSGTTGPPNSPAVESIGAVTGVLTISYNPSLKTVTGYYNGTPVGSYSLAGWGLNPPLTLVVLGISGEGAQTPAGTDTASNFSASLMPVLSFLPSGGNFVLTWSTNATGFTLQSATSVNGTFTNISGATNPYTNPITGGQQFFRLISN